MAKGVAKIRLIEIGLIRLIGLIMIRLIRPIRRIKEKNNRMTLTHERLKNSFEPSLMPTHDSDALFELQDGLVDFESLAHTGVEFCHFSSALGTEDVFHFHGLYNGQILSDLDLLSRGHIKLRE